MELSVKDVTKIEKTEDNGDESVKYSTVMKNENDTITVTVKEEGTPSFTPGDKCELKITNKQTTLTPIKTEEKRGPGRPRKSPDDYDDIKDKVVDCLEDGDHTMPEIMKRVFKKDLASDSLECRKVSRVLADLDREDKLDRGKEGKERTYSMTNVLEDG